MEKIGVVDRLFTKSVNTARGPSEVYSLQIEGAWYNCGFKKPACAEGNTVKVEYQVDTYGNKVSSVSVTSAGGGASSSASSGLDRSISIIRQNSLGHATAVVLASKLKASDDVPPLIIETARRFEAYSAGHEIEEAINGDPVEEAFNG